MISIKILASPNSVLFSDIHPFYKWEKQLRDQGLNVSIYFDHKKLRLSENDYLIINNRYFGKKWNQPSDADPASTPLIKYLQEVKKKVKKLLWWDANDTSVSGSFQVIPYVDSFIKNQILKNKNYYTAIDNPPNMRVWLDAAVEQKQFYPCPQDQLHKINVGWNLGYNDLRYFPYKLHYYLSNITPYNLLSLRFTNVDQARKLDLTFRGKANYDNQFSGQNAVSFQRNKVFELLKSLALNTTYGNVVSRKQYLAELGQSKICISPFGYGEVCYRDFESFIAGSLLIKPSMDHLQTFPNFYIPNETYIPVAWDLHDLKDKAEDAISNYKLTKEIAQNGQELYRKVMVEPLLFVNAVRNLLF